MSLKDYHEYSEVASRIGDAIRADRLSHAYIIEGDSLSKRDEFALDIAKALLCRENPGVGCDSCSICRRVAGGNYQDLYVVESENNSVKDKDILELQQNLMNVPTGEGDRNIAIISDADTMTVRAQNRFLKTLEEPQEGTLIMLLVENSEKLLPTIRSRCQTIRLYNDATEGDQGIISSARMLIGTIRRSDYYFEAKERLDAIVKDRKSAEAFLDSLEHIARNDLLGNEETLAVEEAAAVIPLVEEARKDIRMNVNYKYALGDMLLKMEEILW